MERGKIKRVRNVGRIKYGGGKRKSNSGWGWEAKLMFC